MPEELSETLVYNLMEEDGTRWDYDLLRDICNARDRNLIQQNPIPGRQREDSWFWLLEVKGEFSVRSCYRQLQEEMDFPNAAFWKKLWSLNLPGKIIIFLWRTCRLCLPTAAALATKNVDLSINCPWCRSCVEDSIHILFTCNFAQDVWKSVGLWEVISSNLNPDIFETMQKIFSVSHKNQRALVGLFCWSLWNRRNRWVWDRVNTSVFGVKAAALNLFNDWKKAQEEVKVTGIQKMLGDRRWCKPPAGWLKVNIDAAWVSQANTTSMGCVIRDEAGEFVRARCSEMQPCVEPKMAEALSLKEALAWIKDWRSAQVIFETDSKLLVDALTGSRGKSFFDTIVNDCVELLKHCTDVLVVFAYRSANSVAHALAKAAHSMSGSQEWINIAPEIIECIIADEKF